MFIEARLATGTRSDGIVVREERSAAADRQRGVGRCRRQGEPMRGAARRTLAGQVEIVSGVEAREQVVVGGLERMVEGMPVAPRGRATTGESDKRAGPNDGQR